MKFHTLLFLATVSAAAGSSAGCRFDFDLPADQTPNDRDATAGAPDAIGAIDAGLIDAGLTDAADVDAMLPDGDGDGVPDVDDNCLIDQNPQQFDEDQDGVGDVCDNCPHVANSDQANVGELNNAQPEDLVGDACDPRPMLGGDIQSLFLGFSTPEDLNDWGTAGPNDFQVAGGMLMQRDNSDLALAWRNDLGAMDQTFEARVTYRNLTVGPVGYRWRGVAIVGMFERDGNFGSGLGCGEMHDIFRTDQARENVTWFTGPGFDNTLFGLTTLEEDRTVTYRGTTANSADVFCESEFGFWGGAGAVGLTGTGIAISTWGTGVDVEYLIVYTR